MGITNRNAPTTNVQFYFLEPNRAYKTIICIVATNAHGNHNPNAFGIEKVLFKNTLALDMNLTSDGGFAMSAVRQ